MAGGKRWTQKENKLLAEMVEAGMSVEDIVRSGRLLGRTAKAIIHQIRRLGSFGTRRKSLFGAQVGGVDIISLEEVLKRFSDAFQQVCEAQELSKLELGRYRMIFVAAKDYGPLLAHYEGVSRVEEEVAELRKMVEEVKAQLAGAS